MLLREYAIDPAVMTDWDAAKAIYEGMGAHLGRLWTPVWKQKVWKARVRELVSAAEQAEAIKPVQAKSVKEKHLPHLERTMWPVRPDVPETTSWMDAAQSTHAIHPYHAIVSNHSLTGHPMLPANNLSSHDPQWQVGGTVSAPRTVAGLTGSVEGILHTSAQLVFVDPYFGTRLTTRAMWEPVTAYIRSAHPTRGFRSSPLEWIEIHTERKASTTTTSAEWQGFIRRLGLPAGVRISLVWWDERALHNRYILGDLCGAMFGTGLDMASAHSTQTDTVVRLSEEVRKEHLDKHVNQTIIWQSDPARVW